MRILLPETCSPYSRQKEQTSAIFLLRDLVLSNIPCLVFVPLRVKSVASAIRAATLNGLQLGRRIEGLIAAFATLSSPIQFGRCHRRTSAPFDRRFRAFAASMRILTIGRFDRHSRDSGHRNRE